MTPKPLPKPLPMPLSEQVEPGWAAALASVRPQLTAIDEFLRAEVAEGRPYHPPSESVLRAFSYPLDRVRVLIVGQDPYPTPGHATGLAFAVERQLRPLPRSLQNIYAELRTDLGYEPPPHGDLSRWAQNGVMLLNRVLTVGTGTAGGTGTGTGTQGVGVIGSHRGRGWEAVTEAAVRELVARDQPLVAILWGREAQSLRPILGATPVIASAHPSPLSASRGFFGSKPFSRANEILVSRGADPIDWSLE